MVDFLRIQGVTAPVENGSASVEYEDIGEVTRAEDGTLVRDRVAVKRVWSLSLLLQEPSAALAWVDWVLGQKSQVWSFDSHVYSSKGVPVTATGAAGTVGAQFGNSLSWPSSSTVVLTDGYQYNGGASKPWTVAFWWFNGTLWQHIVETSTGIKYINGVASGSPTFTTTGATSVTITNPNASLRYMDDLCVSTFVWPATWPAAVYSAGRPLGPAPRLTATGLFIDNNSAPASVVGEVMGVDLAQGYLNGTWYANLARVKVKLSEV